MSALAALEVTSLRKRYGGKLAVDDLTFRVGEGEVFGILGPNGAGLLVLAGYALAFGLLARRLFRWE